MMVNGDPCGRWGEIKLYHNQDLRHNRDLLEKLLPEAFGKDYSHRKEELSVNEGLLG